ncbi:MAG: thiol reductant ABC exporter subunit CydC [Nocardioidaceae bacterium]
MIASAGSNDVRTSARALRCVLTLTGPLRARLSLTVALGAAAIVAALALLAVSGTLISRAALRPEVLALMPLIVATRVLSMARAGFRYGERLASHDLALRALARLRVRLYERLAPLVPGSRAGDALTRLVGDVETLQDLYLRAIAPPLVAAAVLAAACGFMAIVLPLAALVLAAGLLAGGVLVPAATVTLSRRSGLREAPARGRLVNELVEVVHAAPELAVAGRTADAAERIHAADRALLAVEGRDARLQGVATALGGALQGLTLVAVLAIGADAVAAGALDGILLAAVVLVAFGAFEAVIPLGEAARRLAACAGAAGRVEEVVRAVPPVADPPAPVELPATGSLVADGVTVVPPGATGPVVRDISLAVAPGDRIAIVGPSGAGKTTLARALVRFVDVAGGAISFGGLDLRRAHQSDVRHAIRLVGQDAHVFTTTLRRNVAIGRSDAGDEEIVAALERVGLGTWLSSLPRGLDTPLGEEGAALSGGERRRVALARGFIADAACLVLDEPTAHLDAASARSLLGTLGSDRDDPRGIVVIVHTCAGLEDFDEVIVLSDGRVAERGTHHELLAAGGAYAALADEHLPALRGAGDGWDPAVRGETGHQTDQESRSAPIPASRTTSAARSPR